jgi:hypothetical protein
MPLTVDQMSRLTAYVAAGSDIERFLKESAIPDTDRDEAQEYWDEMQEAVDSLEPGQQLMVPGEWT